MQGKKNHKSGEKNDRRTSDVRKIILNFFKCIFYLKAEKLELQRAAVVDEAANNNKKYTIWLTSSFDMTADQDNLINLCPHMAENTAADRNYTVHIFV